ncbi:MAG: bifunctional adenosylcobinamide kinase/adenosylcobinamide-phosphate guanylyltransferase [Candidatus Accumulibacter sp.]|jgi:adenosylcobinamide kinase/adenosylcobinamide-phosphate guanylyltransferase|nr:bifunctional adenosylcobinamide kinase/adenosylcobinamide-phosphate guanylyltransferase [Accumulibacter sp.]
MAELIIGGARSGKSAHAEKRARDAEMAGQRIVYIATAEARDEEMAARIARHRARRPPHWATKEITLHLAQALDEAAAPDVCIIVDCLTLWLTNLFFSGEAAARVDAGLEIDCPLLRGERQALEAALPQLPGRVILVSNEVGCGIVPAAPVARAFADEQGRLNQRVAALCGSVTLMVAGLPLRVI